MIKLDDILDDISADTPDWSREKKGLVAWDPSRSLLASIRAYQTFSLTNNLFSQVAKGVAIVRHRFWSVVTGADIPVNTEIGGGLLIPHPNGIVIHSNAKIGPNCLIFQQVTVGTTHGSMVPVIGGHVDIGAGAKILGGIIIGNHVKIGANSVVLNDVPSGKTAIGIPAKIIDKK